MQEAAKGGYRAEKGIRLPPSPLESPRIPAILEIYLREKCGWEVSLNEDGTILLTPLSED